MYESEMYPAIIDFFKKRKYNISFEVEYLGKRIDLVAKNNEEILAVELKVNRWRKALQQARVHALVADKSYVALHQESIDSALNHRDLFLASGVGLLEVNGQTKEVIKAKQSEYIHKGLKELIIKRMGRKWERR